MRSLLLITLFFVSTTLVNSQPHTPRTFVLVTDFGQLYSGYDWEKSNVELMEGLGKNLADEVMAGSVESAWPEGIGSLTARVENRSMMALYRVYYITTLQNSVVILGVKANENRYMPANMQSEKDIYFVVGQSGVDLTNVKTSTTPPKTTTAAGNFAAQWNEITEDFGSGFASTRGSVTVEEDDGMVVIYSSLKDLEGSTSRYLLEDNYAATTLFHADFPTSTNFEAAIQNYKKLIQQVETTNLSCCTLVKKEEYVDGNNRAQSFTVVDSEFGHVNMVIKILLDQGESNDDKGVLVADWKPVLEIYEK